MNREFSAGGVVFKKWKVESGKFKILWLVTKQANLPRSSHPPGIWRLPKGWLDDREDMVPGPLARGEKRASEKQLRKTALKEVREEGGVEAKIIDKIGTIKFFFTSTRGRVLKFATFYLMEWQKDLAGGHDFETERVEWLPYVDARKRLTYSSEKKILDEAKEILETVSQGVLL